MGLLYIGKIYQRIIYKKKKTFGIDKRKKKHLVRLIYVIWNIGENIQP